jgi:hypothetical protein
MPGARLKNITHLADKEVSSLGKNDTVIVWGGASDISKNETNIGLKHLGKFVNSRQNTNIIIVTAPHKHDLQETYV